MQGTQRDPAVAYPIAFAVVVKLPAAAIWAVRAVQAYPVDGVVVLAAGQLATVVAEAWTQPGQEL
jgi:hypothetical protein